MSDDKIESGIQKRLRKLADKENINNQKPIGVGKLDITEFYEVEAEEGSDNENHDGKVKKLANKEEEFNDLDLDLEGLIDDDSVGKLNERKILGRKYLEEEIKIDKENVRKVINGPDRKRTWSQLDKKPNDEEISQRIRKMKQSLTFENKNDKFGKKLTNVSKYRKLLSQEEEEKDNNDENNEHLNEIILKYEKDVKKKISEETSEFKKTFQERMKENKEILSNVVDLNKTENIFIPKQTKNNFKHSFLNPKNSVLNAIKNDKYKTTTPILDKQTQASLKENGKNLYSVFGGNNTNSIHDSEKKQQLSNIFKSDLYTESNTIIKLNKN